MSPAHFNAKTTAEEAAREFAANIKGRNVLITGVTPGGLGAEVARVVAKEGAGLVILASRNAASIDKLKDSIIAETPTANLRSLVVDFSSLSSVRTAASTVLSYTESLDVIINNVGIIASPKYALTSDGFETSLATNHLGPFLFNNLTRPRLFTSSPRIVNVSSLGHQISPFRFEDYNFSPETFNEWVAYGQTKTASILFTQSLVQRWGIESITLHPGVVWTNGPGKMTKEEQIAAGFIKEDGSLSEEKWSWKTVAEGASTTITAAFDPSLSEHNGAFLDDNQIANNKVAEYALDRDNAEKLWELSEKLVGEKF